MNCGGQHVHEFDLTKKVVLNILWSALRSELQNANLKSNDEIHKMLYM